MAPSLAQLALLGFAQALGTLFSYAQILWIFQTPSDLSRLLHLCVWKLTPGLSPATHTLPSGFTYVVAWISILSHFVAE